MTFTVTSSTSDSRIVQGEVDGSPSDLCPHLENLGGVTDGYSLQSIKDKYQTELMFFSQDVCVLSPTSGSQEKNSSYLPSPGHSGHEAGMSAKERVRNLLCPFYYSKEVQSGT